MAWDFETDPDDQATLDWADSFVREEVEPLDLLWGGLEFTPPDARLRAVIDPLKDEVRREQAMQQLQRTDKPIKQVALAVGFRNEKSFSRAFRAWTGESPGAFRQRFGASDE